MKVVIMAGGKGTRIASLNSEVPKPMISILGKPILEYQIEVLKQQGYSDFILVVGHLKNVIIQYFGDGSNLDVRIQYIIESIPLGTAGALYYLKEKITEDFLLLNGDVIFDINVERFLMYHKKKGSLVTLFTHPNDHPYDSGVIIADNNNCVQSWLCKEEKRIWYRNRVNAGIHMISPEIFEYASKKKMLQEERKLDLDRDILHPLISSRRLYVYDSTEYVKDMGTPKRLWEVVEDIREGKVSARNLKNQQKAIFIDRDGTINKYVGFLRKIDEFELETGVEDAIRKINKTGYLVIVVTNQPVIARGEVTDQELNDIHNKMETLLGKQGAYIDAIYYCPHHPDSGYEGEIKALKVECDCRKPKPGMLLKAAEDFNIDLTQSWMVGDNKSDIQAGQAAGCFTALIQKKTGIIDCGQTWTVNSLLDFANRFGEKI